MDSKIWNKAFHKATTQGFHIPTSEPHAFKSKYLVN